jgi:hypothetical protein
VEDENFTTNHSHSFRRVYTVALDAWSGPFRMHNPRPCPPELKQATTLEFADRTSSEWCDELTSNGQGDDYNWGFRIYRTIYTPESDEGRFKNHTEAVIVACHGVHPFSKKIALTAVNTRLCQRHEDLVCTSALRMFRRRGFRQRTASERLPKPAALAKIEDGNHRRRRSVRRRTTDGNPEIFSGLD